MSLACGTTCGVPFVVVITPPPLMDSVAYLANPAPGTLAVRSTLTVAGK